MLKTLLSGTRAHYWEHPFCMSDFTVLSLGHRWFSNRNHF